jgi:hypothetical protein
MRRPLWLLGVIFLATAACSSSSTCDPKSPLLYVDLPGGTDSVSSLTVSGACAEIPGGCAPVASSCQTSGCECRLTLQVNPETFDASPDGVCLIQAVATNGAEFSKAVAFNPKGGSCFDVSGPAGTTVLVQFGPPLVFRDAGGPDVGRTDAGGSDADAGVGGTDADANASDASDGG